ncbi:MAG: hypothetical protein ACLT4C_06590 [Butyricicoccus sp.]
MDEASLLEEQGCKSASASDFVCVHAGDLGLSSCTVADLRGGSPRKRADHARRTGQERSEAQRSPNAVSRSAWYRQPARRWHHRRGGDQRGAAYAKLEQFIRTTQEVSA